MRLIVLFGWIPVHVGIDEDMEQQIKTKEATVHILVVMIVNVSRTEVKSIIKKKMRKDGKNNGKKKEKAGSFVGLGKREMSAERNWR